MKIEVKPFDPNDLNSDLFIYYSPPLNDSKRTKLKPPWQSYLKSIRNFSGKKNDMLIVASPDQSLPNLLLIGAGDEKKISPHFYYESGHLIVRAIRQLKPQRVDIHCLLNQMSTAQLLESLLTGYYSAAYRYKKSKNHSDTFSPKKMVCHIDGRDDISKWKTEVEQSVHLAEAIQFARDLANRPANLLTPGQFASAIRSKFAKNQTTAITVFKKRQLRDMGMNALLAVSSGSKQDPVLIQMQYKSSLSRAKTIALIGKGVTFDSGGISIKPATRMEEMKYDMAGGAAVAALLWWASKTKPALNIIGIIPAAENLPGQNALKPGDVIDSFDGTSIEVINTDAEGRLLLADALGFVQKNFNPNWIIDLATLTGSVVVALGSHASGLFGNDNELNEYIVAAGESAAERVWKMPLWDIYARELESDVADIKNLGGRYAGSITAAKFLQKFIKDCPWSHLDIAGTAYKQKSVENSYAGATGVGVRLLTHLIRRLCANDH